MAELHNIQMLILRELLFRPNSKFTELNIQGLSSDHFSYHINTLIKDGFVEKNTQRYSLTIKGKEFANTMDTDVALIEKQPKVAVMIVAVRVVDDRKQVLIQERTKEPYFGFKGFITGKVRFGEKIVETARRELKEETGLDCNHFHLKKVLHEHVMHEENGNLLEDKIFHIFTAVEPTGKLVNTSGGKNRWVTVDEFLGLENRFEDEVDIYNYSDIEEDLDFPEQTYFVKSF